MTRIEDIDMTNTQIQNVGLHSVVLGLGGVALWTITSVAAIRIIRHYPGNATIRAAAVALGVLGFIPWQLAMVKLIRTYDEYTRRVYMIAFSISFALTALFVVACDLLQRAGFIDYVSLMTIWMVMVGSWAVALGATECYFRR